MTIMSIAKIVVALLCGNRRNPTPTKDRIYNTPNRSVPERFIKN